ncbi:hypothetical protein BS17DRAFT_796354 [Gyrodon lividus]|nr:hypothetical protein BS17DRAFT_796354 [Gyrodon lividus]
MFRVDSPQGLGVVPEFPPMAEVRERNSVLLSTGGAVARRESMNSMMSNGSDPDTQFLIVPTNQDVMDPPTPMSVRPFSPSESFSFPKPPVPQKSPDWSSNRLSNSFFFAPGGQGYTSAQSSAATLVHINTPPRALTTDLPLAAVSTSLFQHQVSTTSAPSSPVVAVTIPAADPFADPTKLEFADVEVIRRPFMPTMDDELAVLPGDKVRIMQVFDDGWAVVEKFTASKCNERGLIPVDCLREAGQALPVFLAQKRVSSYTDDGEMLGTAL